jgi:hypothetical protein
MNSKVIYNKLMTHKVNLKKLKRNSYGDFSVLSTTTGLKGFVQYGEKLITKEKGEIVTCTAIVFLKDNCGIDINWEYWQIDQTFPYIRSNLIVESIDPIDDPRNGKTHHFEILVK